jgi:hypothetical protein
LDAILAHNVRQTAAVVLYTKHPRRFKFANSPSAQAVVIRASVINCQATAPLPTATIDKHTLPAAKRGVGLVFVAAEK